MSFTAKLLNAIKRDAGWKITVEFTDGADVRVESYRFTGSTTKQLKSFIRNEALKLADNKTADFSAHIGATLDLTVTPPTPYVPTAAEIAKTAWFDDWRKLNQLTTITSTIPNLATAQTNTLIDNLRASLETNWINSYLGDI